jgi:hypothetical protein
MIEIAIKIKRKADNGLTLAIVPTVDGSDPLEHLYAHVLQEIIEEAVVPALGDFSHRLGVGTTTYTGSKAMFFADQAGLLPDAPEGKN